MAVETANAPLRIGAGASSTSTHSLKFSSQLNKYQLQNSAMGLQNNQNNDPRRRDHIAPPTEGNTIAPRQSVSPSNGNVIAPGQIQVGDQIVHWEFMRSVFSAIGKIGK